MGNHLKRTMNVIDLIAWIKGNADKLKGARINNVYGDRGLVWFKLRTKEGTETLIMQPGVRLNLTKRSLKAPEKILPFIGGLRKHVRDGVIEEVKLPAFDRLIEFYVISKGRSYKLVLELLPRGVLVLIDEEGKILQASEYKEMRDRVIKIKEKYKYPPLNEVNPLEMTSEEALKLAKKGKDLIRGLVRGLKIPPDVAEEILARLGLEKNKKDFGKEEIEMVVEELRRILAESEEGKGYIIVENGKYKAFEPFKPVEEHVEFDSFNDAIDEYFRKVNVEEIDIEDEVKKEEERLRRSLEELKEKIKEYEEKAKKYEELAIRVSERLDELSEEYKRKGYFEVDGIRVEKDPESYVKELFSKASEYKKKAKRARASEEELVKEIEKVREKVLERIGYERARKREKEWYEKYHWMITSKGNLVIAGRDASQNESVVKKYLEDDEIFMHAEVQGAPATVLKSKEPDEEELKEAAVIAACYSKAWKEGRGGVNVYWVYGRQVSKSPPTGQYLAKGAFIIEGKRNYIYDVPLVLGIGVELHDGLPRVIVGPPDLVKKRSIVYAIVVPGDESRGDAAERIKKAFIKKVEEPYLRGMMKAIEKEELAQRLPGKVKVVRIGRGEGSKS